MGIQLWCTMNSLYILFLYHKLLVSTMRKFYQGFKCTRVRNVYKMSKCIFGVKTAAHITSLVYVRLRINMFYTHSSLSYTIMQIDLYDSVLAGIQVASSPTIFLCPWYELNLSARSRHLGSDSDRYINSIPYAESWTTSVVDMHSVVKSPTKRGTLDCDLVADRM